jgi:hypothetical protein
MPGFELLRWGGGGATAPIMSGSQLMQIPVWKGGFMITKL